MRLAAHLRTIVAAIALAAVGCPGIGKAIGGCRRTKDCAEDGRCALQLQRTGDSVARCYSESRVDCVASSGCRDHGVCDYDTSVSESSDYAVCRALTMASCLASTECKANGACTANGSFCEVTAAGCSRSEACEKSGRCASYDGACVASDVPEERQCDAACTYEGACVAKGKTCVATRDEDCGASVVCEERGRCRVDPALGVCVARNAGACKASNECTSRRRCDSRPSTDLCVVSEAPCNFDCWAMGMCAAREGTCLTESDARCAESVDCAVEGRCHLHPKGTICVPTTKADCESSLECKAYGRCALVGTQCVKPPDRFTTRMSCVLNCDEDGACLSSPEMTCVTAEQAGLPPWRPRPRRPPRTDPAPRPPEPSARLVIGGESDASAACVVIAPCLAKLARNSQANGQVTVMTDGDGHGLRATYSLAPYKDHPVSAEVVACFLASASRVRTSHQGESRCSFKYAVGPHGELSGGGTGAAFFPILTRRAPGNL